MKAEADSKPYLLVSFLFMPQDLKDDLTKKHLDHRFFDQPLGVTQL